MFMIFYALIGIPVNGFLFAYLGDFFGKVVCIYKLSKAIRKKNSSKSIICILHVIVSSNFKFLSAYERFKAYKMSTTKNYVPYQLGLIAQIVLYLIPGIVIFLFLPSLIFSYFEEWPYTVSIYYSFVTLTTIGFGDFVPTFQPHQVRSRFSILSLTI